MPVDIANAISGQPIKNGTIVVKTAGTGGDFQTIDTYVSNVPTIGELDEKYDDRFDDERYYTGDTPN